MGRMMLPLVLAAAVAAAPSPPAAAVVEQVVAVVRNPAGAVPRIITLTKLTEEARIALVSRGAVAAAFQPLDAEALRAALEWLVDETLVADEAARLQVDDVDPGAVAAELRRFQERFDGGGYARFLALTELTDEEVAAALARTLRVQRHLETRAGRGARATDDEVEAYVRARGLVPPSKGAREVVRAQLEEDRARSQVRDILADLRARADVRVLDPALRPAPEARPR
jgi:hypothetical protein